MQFALILLQALMPLAIQEVPQLVKGGKAVPHVVGQAVDGLLALLSIQNGPYAGELAGFRAAIKAQFDEGRDPTPEENAALSAFLLKMHGLLAG